MLVNLKEVLAPALQGGYGVGCFNVFGWEDAKAVVAAGEALGAPVILSASLDLRGFMPIDVIAGLFRALGEAASVPVCAHLDHTYEVPEVLRAVDAGFTSVMFDGSQLPLEENIRKTAQVVDYAHAAGASAEAEIGSVPYAEGRDHIKAALTDAAEAAALAEQSGLDALAVSVGNVHRLTAPGAEIDFDRLAEIEARVPQPLVIHGTSGIHEADVTRLAATRVCKFNVGTTLRQAFGRGLRESLAADPERFDRLEIMSDVMPKMSEETIRVIRLLGWQS